MQKPLKTKISVTLDSDLVDTLRKLADKDDRSLSQYINRALRLTVEHNNLSQS